MGESSGLSIEELAEQGGVPVRTVRFYIAERLLPRPEGRGKGVSYGEEHLLRLRLIRLLVDRRIPLAEIRTRLAGIGIDEVRALLAGEEQRTTQIVEAPTPKAYVSALLDRARAEPLARPAFVPPPPPAPPAFAAPPPQAPPVPPPAAPAAPPAGGPPAVRPVEVGPTTPTGAPTAAPADWRRFELAPGVELHVRADAATREHRLVDRILSFAGLSGRRFRWLPFGARRPEGD